MSEISFNFKGLMAPVFTSFNSDNAKSVNVTNVDSYAEFLKKKCIHGVLVNGTSGEGTVMSVGERKIVAEAWSIACRKHDLALMLQIGGAPLADVLELAEHAQHLKVDAVLCLPELYFKPRTAQDLIVYLRKVGERCRTIPLLYYHIPMFTGIALYMPVFCDMAEREIPNFAGLKYTSGDLAEGSDCLKQGRCVFLGAETILSGALMLGFDSAIVTTLNICPELSIEIFESMQTCEVLRAIAAQQKLTVKVKEILAQGGGDWVSSMKQAFNNMEITGLNAGTTRFPDKGENQFSVMITYSAPKR